jgi:guanylate kinase
MEDEPVDRKIRELVKNYRTTEAAEKIVAGMKIALLVGVAAAGKDSIKQELLKTGYYARIVTTIPRAPREGEVDGVNYYFIDEKTVRENLVQEKYFEAKLVHGRVYGTTTAELERIAKEDKIALGDVDVQGVEEFHAILEDNLRAIFIIPPDFRTWQERWQKRGDTIDQGEMKRRMLSAQAELSFALRSSYYRFVVNDDLMRAARVADDLIRKEKRHSYKDDFARLIAEKLHDDMVAYLSGQPRSSMQN